MILVTVGMHTQPFDRLVRAAGALATITNELVIVQRGASTCVPVTVECDDYVDQAQMERWLSEARVVVSHAGAGIILGALGAGKPLVLAPRQAKLGEHFDDHQFELAEALARQGQAVIVTDLSAETLVEAVDQAVQLGAVPVGETGLHTALRDWLAQQASRPQSRWSLLFRQLRRGG